MKRIIDAKTYNTETATHIANASSSCGKSDFNWWDEDLYRSPKGQYFVSGEGHAMSRWSESYGNMSGPGSGIELLTREEAIAWCERNDIKVSLVEAEFGLEAG